MSTFTAENRAVLMRELDKGQPCTSLRIVAALLLDAHDQLRADLTEEKSEHRATLMEHATVSAELQEQERVDFIRAGAGLLFANLHHTMRIQPDEQRRCWELAQRLWEAKPDGC